MVSRPKNTCNWNLKFIEKIGLKINIKIKLGQILETTVIDIYLKSKLFKILVFLCLFIY